LLFILLKYHYHLVCTSTKRLASLFYLFLLPSVQIHGNKSLYRCKTPVIQYMQNDSVFVCDFCFQSKYSQICIKRSLLGPRNMAFDITITDTVKPAHAATSIQKSLVLKCHLFLVLSQKITCELNLFLKINCLIRPCFLVPKVTS
jgi:hypothetical protein